MILTHYPLLSALEAGAEAPASKATIPSLETYPTRDFYRGLWFDPSGVQVSRCSTALHFRCFRIPVT